MKTALIITPHYGPIDTEHDQCVRRTMKANGFQLLRAGGSAIDQVRTSMACLALENSDADVFLWIDSDIVFDPSDAASIVEQARDLKLVCGAYSEKKPGGAMCFQASDATPKTLHFSKELGSTVGIYGAGFGFVATHRCVFERLREILPAATLGCGGQNTAPYFMPLIRNGGYAGEDFSFFIRARDAGFPLYLDTRVRLGHKGAYTYRIEDTFYKTPTVTDFEINL